MAKKNIIIGVSGGIACYKIVDLINSLKDKDAEINVLMTKSSLALISEREFKSLGCNVYSELFRKGFDYKGYIKQNKNIKHISLADKADILVIAPATANIIGKIANGIADDLLTTTALAVKCPILICPSMNCNMYSNHILQDNISRLKRAGYFFIEPEYGALACGYKGVGRLANIKKIKNEIINLINKKNQLKGKKILVTAGPTSEEIDPVRVITNKSSGKMGVRIAEQAFLIGANVILLRSSNSAMPNCNIREEKFTTAKDLFLKIKKHINNADIVIHSAAVSDFTVNNKSAKKIKSGKKLHLELAPTAKIIEKLKKLNKNIFLVGFKAEYKASNKELIDSAYRTLKKADADMVVANDVGRKNTGFDVDTNEVFVVDKDKTVEHIGIADKMIVAEKIWDSIIKRI